MVYPVRVCGNAHVLNHMENDAEQEVCLLLITLAVGYKAVLPPP